MKKFIIYFYIIVTNLFLINYPNAREVKNIDNYQLIELYKQEVPIIDIRTYNEWQKTGVIENSHLITFFDDKGNYNLDKWVANLKKKIDINQPYIILCRSGKRSKILSQIIIKKNISDKFYNSKEGIIGWIKSNQETIFKD